MDLTFTERAIDVLDQLPRAQDGLAFRLEYDLEGCGCSNDGVIHLMHVSQLQKDAVEIKTNRYRCFVPRSDQVYFDEHLIIDYSTTYNMFQLKSHQRMINPRMTLNQASSLKEV